jgi:hypothetical protein
MAIPDRDHHVSEKEVLEIAAAAVSNSAALFVASSLRCEFRAKTQSAPPLRLERALRLAKSAISKTG